MNRFHKARFYGAVLSCLCSSIAMAEEPILFKQSLIPKHGWLNYGLIVALLMIIALILAKKYNPKLTLPSGCQLIEKKQLSPKTAIYVIEYQKQRFLIADNQHALAMQSLMQQKEEQTDETQ